MEKTMKTMKTMKYTLLVFIATLLLANLSYGRPPAPKFPRTTVTLNVEDRLNQLALVAYRCMSESNKTAVTKEFLKLDHSEINTMEFHMLKIELLKTFTDYTPELQDHMRVGDMPLKETIKDGIDFGVRWHLYMRHVSKNSRSTGGDRDRDRDRDIKRESAQKMN